MHTLDDTLHYIRSNYLTLAKLAERAELPPSRIEEFIEQRCLPAHSYEITERFVIRSFFGEREGEHVPTRYFSAALVDRARRIGEQSKHSSLAEIAASEKQVFFDRYRELFVAADARSSGFEDYFAPDGSLHDEVLIAHMEQEWEHVLDGTYALCTPTSEVRDIVTKEVMAKKIKRLTDDNTRTTLTAADREDLLQSVRLLDASCSAFAPDEVERSSRHHRIDRVLRQYGLSL